MHLLMPDYMSVGIIRCCWIVSLFIVFHFLIWTKESLNMAVHRICHNIPCQLFRSNNSRQKSHFLLEIFHTQQTGKLPQLILKLLLLDIGRFVSRMPFIAKLVKHFIAIPKAWWRLVCQSDHMAVKGEAEKMYVGHFERQKTKNKKQQKTKNKSQSKPRD